MKRSVPTTSFVNTNIDVSGDVSEEEARANNASIMDELKNRLQKAETASEEYQRQLSMLQNRLNDMLLEQEALEDRLQEGIGKIEVLENDKLQAAREKREMENQFDTERIAVMKDKEERKMFEDELQSVNQRLKDTLAQRETRYNADEEKGPERARKSSDAHTRKFAGLTTGSEFGKQIISGDGERAIRSAFVPTSK
jgi:predicted RNase H-like nuclease (RuvC/YqgF family)